MALDGKLRRHADRSSHARPAGGPFAGYVERGAMVDRGARKRQAQGDVDAFVEAAKLDRDVALIVVHRHDQVELAAAGPPEERVRRPGPAGFDALSTGFGDGRRDLALLLIAEEAAFAGVRVDAGHGDPRALEAKPADALVAQLDRPHNARARGRLDGALERSVRGHVD